MEEEKKLCLRVRKDGGGTDFYAFDLEKGTHSPILESLENDAPVRYSDLVSFNSCIYNAGFSGSHSPPMSSINAFCFDRRNPSLGWQQVPGITFSHSIYEPVICNNKIYSLSAVDFVVYDPHSNPPSLQVSPVLRYPSKEIPNYPLLSDPCSGRILMHFDYGGLYAFNPEDENQPFECIDRKFNCWSPRTVLADGVLYFFLLNRVHVPLRAYDLGERKWLRVTWTARYKHGEQEWDHLFHLGNGNMCVVSYYDLFETLFTYSFKVEKVCGRVRATPGVCKKRKYQVNRDFLDVFII